MPTTVQLPTSRGVSTHVVSLRGLAGAIFWCILVAFTLNMIAFLTEGWAEVNTDEGNVKLGLWQSCLCQPGLVSFTMEAWFRSSQAMVTIGFLFLGATLAMIIVYMFLHKFNKNFVIKMLFLLCFITGEYVYFIQLQAAMFIKYEIPVKFSLSDWVSNFEKLLVQSKFHWTMKRNNFNQPHGTARLNYVKLSLFSQKFTDHASNFTNAYTLYIFFVSVVFLLVGFVTFGMYTTKYKAVQGFSYIFGIISCFLCITACILSCVQMRRAAASACCAPCCPCLCCRDDLR